MPELLVQKFVQRKEVAMRFDLEKNLRVPGLHNAGHSLRLNVRGGSAIWEYQVRAVSPNPKKSPGKPTLRTISLGSARGPDAIGIIEARLRASERLIQLRRAGNASPGQARTDVAEPVGRPFRAVLERSSLAP